MSLSTNDVLRVIDKMIDTKDENYTQEIAEVSNSLKLEINCLRLTGEDCIMNSSVGQAVSFEIYVIKDGVSIDCVHLDVSDDFNEDISYLLNCYS